MTLREPPPSLSLTTREAWVAPSYFALYLASLFVTLESEIVHWATLVGVPLAIAFALAPRERRGFRPVLATFGLRRAEMSRGVWLALALGAAITAVQMTVGGQRDAIWELIRDGSALWRFPLTLLLMLLLAGFTEEFFFRGFLQTRIERLVRSPWVAVAIVSVLFGVYHLPYAYLNPNWSSAGDWGAAWAAAMGNGLLGGAVLGALYVWSGRNLLPCILLHSLINAAPAMTLLNLSISGVAGG
jgi:membrane protease YdiL (CAAX protease family)